ncbi:MAG: 30S ribosomal protein THX [Bacteroidales bacterium]|nr:30S ribosomal protein THX [Bacteroidales bacterium]
MGKGDKKSRRGKIHIGSHGTRRPRKTVPVIPVSTTAEKPVKVADVKVKKVEKVIEESAEAVAETKKVTRKTTKKPKEETPAE